MVEKMPVFVGAFAVGLLVFVSSFAVGYLTGFAIIKLLGL